jgi:hypothetical protein
MYISQESPEQTQTRLLKVLAHAEIEFFEGMFTFQELPLSDFPHHANPEALAFVRDDDVRSQLVPSNDTASELFSVFCFHFADDLDNSGFVVSGQNSNRGGIFNYWGCPA